MFPGSFGTSVTIGTGNAPASNEKALRALALSALGKLLFDALLKSLRLRGRMELLSFWFQHQLIEFVEHTFQ